MRIEFIIASEIREHPLELIGKGMGTKYIESLVAGIECVMEVVSPRPVVVRFSDLKSSEYRHLRGGEEHEPEEKNPMLGWRGASRYISDKYQSVFRLECQAIRQLRRNWENIWVMIPFVRTPWEAEHCLKIMSEEGLRSEGSLRIWLMAEVPSFAFAMEDFNKLPIDGYSIGSNDLCQLILGVDRDSGILTKMGYFDEQNRSVMKAMEMILAGAHRASKTCSICGESVSNYEVILRKLISLGIDSVSVNPDAVIRSKAVVHEIQGGQ